MLALASAGVAGVILSAICAMTVPRKAIKAAKIIRLRMKPHPIGPREFTTPAAKPRRPAGREGCHFDEKDDRSVNGSFFLIHPLVGPAKGRDREEMRLPRLPGRIALWLAKIPIENPAIDPRQLLQIRDRRALVDLVHGLADQAELDHRAIAGDEARVRGAA
jgi:hypothetical protein